jgi:branched-subunit amino acid aminotransferase/4-amino-4-deoxychorismate lyase
MASKLPKMDCTVDVIGDSHLARLFRSGTRLPCKVDEALWCRGGAGVRYLESIVDDIEWEEVKREPLVSDLVVVFIGGNDLDKPNVDVRALASTYANLYDRLKKLGSEVVVLTQWSRPGARIGGVNFQTNALYFDHLLTEQARDFTVWAWDTRLRAHSEFFVDGVHCHQSVYKRVMRYFSAAIFHGIRRMTYGHRDNLTL